MNKAIWTVRTAKLCPKCIKEMEAESVPANPMEAVQIKPMPTKMENGRKKKPLYRRGR